ncbi:DMT family transporter [Oscillospiraceae bacterium MB08-C2-2]|nr:DMT family transporter [Oscillospiraceae bacterium MB08-C2-2]
MNPSKTKSLAYLFLIITTSAWGSLYVVSKYLLTSVEPFTVLFARYLTSGIVLYILYKKKNPQKIERQDIKWIVFIGVVGYFVTMSAQLVGTKLLGASLASLLNALNPISMIIFALVFLKEKITLTKIISVTSAIIGVYIILGGGIQGGAVLGVIACLLAVVSWSLTSIFAKKLSAKYEPMTITAHGVLVAFVCTIPFTAYELATGPQTNLLQPGTLLGLLYLGLVCTALTNVLWNKSLSMIEAGRCALFYPLQPMVAALLGFFFLHESIGLTFILGAALILGGVIFSVVADRKQPVPDMQENQE